MLAALVAWSAAGMQVDLASGPLTPEAALGAICDLALPPDDVAELDIDEPSPVVSEAASPCSDPAPDSAPVITEATWSIAAFTHFPARALMKRIVALCAAFTEHVPCHAKLAEVPDAAGLGAAGLPLRLCRLHC